MFALALAIGCASPPPVAGAGEMPGEETAPSTFVPLDVSRMPTAWGGIPAGRVLHVDQKGNDEGSGADAEPLATIVEALRRAEPGDTVLVHGGVYQSFDPDTGRAFSIDTEDVVVAGKRDELVTIIPASGGTGEGPRLAADGAVLANVVIGGFGSVGVEIGGDGPVKRVVVQNVRVEGSSNGILAKQDLGGRAAVTGLLIDRVTIDGATVQGIACPYGPCNDVHLHEVTVRMRGDAGGAGGDAITVHDGANVWIDQVRIEDATADAIDLRAERVVLSRVRIDHAVGAGVRLAQGGDIQNTIIERTGADAAVAFEGPGRYRLAYSVVTGHHDGRKGAYTLTAGASLKCGRKAANDCCYIDEKSAAGPKCGLLTVDVANTVFHKDSGPLWFPTAKGVGLNGVAFGTFAEPQPVAIGDKRLSVDEISSQGLGSHVTQGIPAIDDRWCAHGSLIDAGVTIDPQPRLDANGLPRVVGAAPDVGPCEAQ